MGLNDIYCTARGSILMLSPLPTIATAYSLLVQDERQREVHAIPKYPGESSAFAVNQNIASQKAHNGDYKGQRGAYENRKVNMFCNYCKKSGHLIEKCYRLHGFPPSFKFTKQKKYPGSIQGNAAVAGEGATDYLPHHGEIAEMGINHSLTQEQVSQLDQLLQQMKGGQSGATYTEGGATANCVAGISSCPPIPIFSFISKALFLGYGGPP